MDIWNLPSNPVDLEQREGRVHRYKGHAVRRNIASRYADHIGANGHADPWQELFDLACAEPDRPSDLRPFWVYPIPGGATIERHVPMLPMSREHGQLEALRRSSTAWSSASPARTTCSATSSNASPATGSIPTSTTLRIDLTPQH